MAELSRPKGVIHCILGKAADMLARFDQIPAENVDAFRAQFIRVMEQAITDSIGTDTVPLSGWVIAPSARQDRRDRINEALRRGDCMHAIASRELVTLRTVQLARNALRKTTP